MAVYTEVANDALDAFLGAYEIGRPLALKGIAEGVENSNYLLRTEAGSFILTLYEKRVREEDLPFFLALLEHLAKNGLHCPQPIKNRAGAALGRLAGPAGRHRHLHRRRLGPPSDGPALRASGQGARPSAPRRRGIFPCAATMPCRWPAGPAFSNPWRAGPTPWSRGSAA